MLFGVLIHNRRGERGEVTEAQLEDGMARLVADDRVIHPHHVSRSGGCVRSRMV